MRSRIRFIFAVLSMKTLSVPRSFANVSSGSVTATVWIEAPPERVFQALASEEVMQWWGGAAYQTQSWRGTVEADGQWRAEGTRKDGSEFTVAGIFTAVERPRLLAMTWESEGIGDLPTQVTYCLDPVNGGTKLTVRHAGFQAPTRACTDQATAWEMALAWLADYAAGQRSEAD